LSWSIALWTIFSCHSFILLTHFYHSRITEISSTHWEETSIGKKKFPFVSNIYEYHTNQSSGDRWVSFGDRQLNKVSNCLGWHFDKTNLSNFRFILECFSKYKNRMSKNVFQNLNEIKIIKSTHFILLKLRYIFTNLWLELFG
jgi:hypothetical protein